MNECMEIDKRISVMHSDTNKYNLITVIVLSYGMSPLYWDTLQSVFQQDYPKLQLIISDDASEKFDILKVKQFIAANQGNNIVEVTVRQNLRNVGTTRHNNIAASFAKGQYIKFIADGDKFLNNTSLRSLWEFAQQYPSHDIVASPCLIVDSKSKKVLYQFPSARRITKIMKSRYIFDLLAYQNIYSAVGMLYRKEFFSDGGFDTSYRYLEDWPTWLRIARKGITIPCSYKPTMEYTLSGISNQSGTAFDSVMLHQDMCLCYEKEVFPFIDTVSNKTRKFVEFQYSRLKNDKNIKKHPVFLFRVYIKKIVKKLLVRLR